MKVGLVFTLLVQVVLQLLEFHLNSLKLFLLRGQLLLFVLIRNVGMKQLFDLRVDLLHNLVVLLESDNPIAEALSCLRCLCDTSRFELGVVEELSFDLVHDLRVNIVLVIVL